MNSLVNMVNGTSDVFDPTTVDEAALVKEYFERNERKKEDEKWLKENKKGIEAVLEHHGKNKMDFGNVRVSLSVPDTSKFDHSRLFDYFLDLGMIDEVTKLVIDEDAIAAMIESGRLDRERLKEVAWVTSTGTPRLTVAKARKGD